LLPPATEKVWAFLKEQPALAGFILAGGSALALLIRHRMSGDLDFIYPASRLPRQRLDALLRKAEEAGFSFRASDDEAALQDFAESALELRDYQQDFLVNDSVKVSFFAPDESNRRILQPGAESKIRVATLPELFKAKSLVSAKRSKTRDWLDLYLLMRDHGFSIFDYRAAFDEAGTPSQCDTGLARLCSAIPQRDDEGYAQLLSNPPSLEEMKSFFTAQRAKLEIESAAEARKRKNVSA
jgi:DNA-binding transcriptional MerR regulator